MKTCIYCKIEQANSNFNKNCNDCKSCRSKKRKINKLNAIKSGNCYWCKKELSPNTKKLGKTRCTACLRKKNSKITCECGSSVSRNNLAKHKLSKSHIKKMKATEKNTNSKKETIIITSTNVESASNLYKISEMNTTNIPQTKFHIDDIKDFLTSL